MIFVLRADRRARNKIADAAAGGGIRAVEIAKRGRTGLADVNRVVDRCERRAAQPLTIGDRTDAVEHPAPGTVVHDLHHCFGGAAGQRNIHSRAAVVCVRGDERCGRISKNQRRGA